MNDVASLRRRAGLTQTRLARLTGVHPMTVSKWERGVLRPNAHQRAILRAAAGKAAAEAEELTGYLNQAYVDVSEVSGMKLSASNVLKGKVAALEMGPISARVVIEIAPRLRIVSVITTDSVKRLGLKVGKRAVAIIKATEVIVGAP